MARLIWTRRALADLDEIAEYIALDNELAARRLVDRVYRHIGQLKLFPRLGPVPPELEDSEYRQIVEPPCRIFYKIKASDVFVIHIIRFEQILRPGNMEEDE